MSTTLKLFTPRSSERAAVRRSLIRIDGVAKTYRSADGPIESLKPLTFDIRDGEFMAVVGPSGCGKSTPLELVSGRFAVCGGASVRVDKTGELPRGQVGVAF